MAILWKRTLGGRGGGGRTVEVRAAGRTRRLVVDGVLHSAWNPGAALTGAVWDPLALAGLLAGEGRPRSVLLLGLGGGAAVRLLQRHLAPGRILAVEADPVAITLARRFFGVGGRGVEVVRADAIRWVRGARGARFDVVIDDLFGESDGEPVRAAGGAAWWRRLARLVAPGGALVVNFAEARDLRTSRLAADAALRRRFPSAAVFSCEGYTNRIAALASAPGAASDFRERLGRLPTVPRRGRGAPRFRVRPLR
jgi:SAM-dependent methyltransferase